MPKGSFRGGVHPPGNKSSTAGLSIVRAQRPSQVVVMLRQATRSALTPIVEKGSAVLMGQKIADSEDRRAVPVHSPVSGKVTGIVTVRAWNGCLEPAVAIESDGEDTLADSVAPVAEVEALSREELLAIIRDAGIVGMGGAEFPTHAKLALPANVKADTFIINGAECEPYLTADHRLMVERPADVVRGAQILMSAVGVSKGIIAVEDNKPDAAEALRHAARAAQGIEVAVVETKYPQGSEKHLIKSVLGRSVPPGCLPFHVGVVVNNVATAVAVADRFDRGMPLIERVVTVTGSAVASPANVLARIGTKAQELIDQCGGYSMEPGKIVFGGPMMGCPIPSTDVSISKGTSGILVLSQAEAKRIEPIAC
ncbi:MAG: electron transport complex subunit RsxC, partial [Firmicutes bacterium]|nr:electron transport complex subunit RsxC [Bacillota bacterium]